MRLERSAATDTRRRTRSRSGRIWLLAAVYFTIPVALYAIGFWLPQIIKAGIDGSDFEVGLLTAIPYLVGAVRHGRASRATPIAPASGAGTSSVPRVVGGAGVRRERRSCSR